MDALSHSLHRNIINPETLPIPWRQNGLRSAWAGIEQAEWTLCGEPFNKPHTKSPAHRTVDIILILSQARLKRLLSEQTIHV